MRVSGKIIEVVDNSCTQGIQVNITNQFDKIGILLAKNRFVPILEELAVTVMSFIKGDGMAGEEAGHDGVERDNAGLEREMGVVAQERPRITGSVGIHEDPLHPFQKAVFIHIITEDQSTFNAANDDMVEHPLSVETGMTWHGQS